MIFNNQSIIFLYIICYKHYLIALSAIRTNNINYRLDDRE